MSCRRLGSMAAVSALLSAAEYLTEEESATVRHEFVAGSVYAMSGASRNHVEITRALHGILYAKTVGGTFRNLDQDTKVWVEASAWRTGSGLFGSFRVWARSFPFLLLG